MYIFLDESYNLKDRTKPQFISINGFKTTAVKQIWKRWKIYRLPFVGKSRIHASDRLFEPLRAKCLKLLNVHPDITLFTAIQEIRMIPIKGDVVYYGKKGRLLFDKVYANILKELLREMNLNVYKKVSIIVDSRKHKRGVLGKKQFQNNMKYFLKNWYPNTISNFDMQPSTSNILLEIADFISNSFYRQYLGQEILPLKSLEGKILKLKNPLGRG